MMLYGQDAMEALKTFQCTYLWLKKSFYFMLFWWVHLRSVPRNLVTGPETKLLFWLFGRRLWAATIVATSAMNSSTLTSIVLHSLIGCVRMCASRRGLLRSEQMPPFSHNKNIYSALIL